MKTSLYLLLTALILVSCTDSDVAQKCSKGKFIGRACNGILIYPVDGDLLDEHRDMYMGSSSFMVPILASIDPAITDGNFDPETFFTADSVFYFSHTEGGIHGAEYSMCSEPVPSITIRNISDVACSIDARTSD